MKDTHHNQEGKQECVRHYAEWPTTKVCPLQSGVKEKERLRGEKQPLIQGQLPTKRDVRKNLPGRLPAVG